jgi:hypothetical protein
VAPPVRVPIETLGACCAPARSPGLSFSQRREVPRLVAEALRATSSSRPRSASCASSAARLERVERGGTSTWSPCWHTRSHFSHAAFAQTAAIARLVVPTRLPAGESVAAIAAELAAGAR